MYSNVISSFQLSACVLQPPHCIYDSKTNLRFIRFAVVILSSPIKFPIRAIFAAKKGSNKIANNLKMIENKTKITNDNRVSATFFFATRKEIQIDQIGSISFWVIY